MLTFHTAKRLLFGASNVYTRHAPETSKKQKGGIMPSVFSAPSRWTDGRMDGHVASIVTCKVVWQVVVLGSIHPFLETRRPPGDSPCRPSEGPPLGAASGGRPEYHRASSRSKQQDVWGRTGRPPRPRSHLRCHRRPLMARLPRAHRDGCETLSMLVWDMDHMHGDESIWRCGECL